MKQSKIQNPKSKIREILDIKKQRDKLGLTQVEFAARLGVDPITISRWERGLSKPSKLALRQLEIMLNNAKPARS